MREEVRVCGVRRLWKREREGEEIAMMRRVGLRGCCCVWGKRRKGEGSDGEGGVKLFRSSSSNLDGGAASVITSSIFEGCSVGVCENKNKQCVSL